MFILRTTAFNPKPSGRSLIAGLKKAVPDLDIQPARVDAEDRLDFLLTMMAEDKVGDIAAHLKRIHDGDFNQAPDRVVRQVIRERWGEDIAYFELSAGQLAVWLDIVLTFVTRHGLRRFCDLAGKDVALPSVA